MIPVFSAEVHPLSMGTLQPILYKPNQRFKLCFYIKISTGINWI